MHATKERKKSDKEGYTISTQAAPSRFNIATILMMAARSKPHQDKRKKLKARDDRRLRD